MRRLDCQRPARFRAVRARGRLWGHRWIWPTAETSENRGDRRL